MNRLTAGILIAACAGAAAGEWPTFHGGPSLTGVTSLDLPDTPTLLWSFKAGAPVSVTPVSARGLVFFYNKDGKLFAVTGSGAEKWSRTLPAVARPDGMRAAPVLEAPLLALDGLLVAASSEGKVYGLDASTGADRWTYDVGQTVQGQPTAFRQSNGKSAVLVLAQPDGALHALDAATGRLLWKNTGDTRTDGSPAVAGDRVFLGNCSAGIYAFSTSNGIQQAGVPLGEGSEVAGGVALIDNLVYSGSRAGKLYCVDMEAKKIVWTNEDCKGEVFTTPAVGTNIVVFAGGDGILYGVSRDDGRRLWSFRCGESSSPVIAARHAVGTGAGSLFLLDLKSGAALWSRKLGDSLSGPAVANGGVVVGTDDGRVVAFGAPSQRRQP